MKAIESILFRSWWLILFCLACLGAYECSLQKWSADYKALKSQKTHLQNEKEKALMLQKKLQRQINSSSDPAWIELTLMKVLGLVPEGQIKVFIPSSTELQE